MLRITGSSSGIKTASTQIWTGPAWFLGSDIKTPSTLTTIITVYDSENSDTTGKTVLCEMEIDAGLGSFSHDLPYPIYANRGIYINMAGQTTNYIVRFAPS